MKKGVSHIEIILSFIIFIGAVSAGLYFFNPISTSKLTDVTFDYAVREIEKSSSTTITSFSVGINNTAIGYAMYDKDVIGIMIEGVQTGMATNTSDLNGNGLKSKREGDNVYVEWDNKDFIKIDFNEEFEDDSLSTSGISIDEDFYDIASSNKETMLSEKKILELNKSYHLDYFALHDNFNLPSRTNFGFELDFGNGDTINVDRDKPDNINIFSESKRVKVLRKNGDRKFADLIVRLW